MSIANHQAVRFKRDGERRLVANHIEENRRKKDRRLPDLRWVPLFRDVEASLVRTALDVCQVLLLPAGATLLKPGEINHNVYILLSGNVSAHLAPDLNPGSAIQISTGECIGELSAIDGKPVSALVLALSESRVLELPADVFWNRLMALPGVAGNLMISLTERMRKSNEQALKSQREQLELVHIKKELDVARQLQISMLPLQRPIFPERRDIEVSGFMESASDVGGDLFDTFFVDDDILFFCIGDVSGHGIAAALFMARIVGLLRILAMNIQQPHRLLEVINDRLCVGNDTNIFVTMFCGFLNVKTGLFTYSNGGHCAPFITNGNEVHRLEIPKGTLVGAFPGVAYSSMEAALGIDDLLLCYTDGVTEAQNHEGEEFSEPRCLDFIKRQTLTSLPELLDLLRDEVSGFTGTHLLDDDCTMLALKRRPAG